MADEKKQNPFENMGPSYEEETPDHPPAYTAAGPSTPGPSIPAAVSYVSQTSNKPIAIPAIASLFDSPFIRAYPPVLKKHQLPKESFLAFIDQLNKEIAASPPLQVLDATGGILSSVPILFPLHWIGSAVSGLANLGSQGVSKSRTDSSIKQANKDIFGPRGLKVEIAKLDALAHIAKIPILDAQGKINREAPLSRQLWNEPSTAYAENNDRKEQDISPQRIRTLQPWIAELEFEILPWSSKSKLTRFNAALRKRNDPKDQETRDDGKRCDAYTDEADAQEASLRKALWLVIREVETDEKR
ncbi:hypothetical protein N7457_004585 [Penicillium paradoxum]|uniref:uncharacterized protein n=1 Tax=Penicillium paradoxum TaxID=176176 RepID=UPI0025494828|nr:uncharacterized protein N7457_004585 [Penicillium paradoxum]KAJ5782811.1 hypothetical protein N7457_004585 [Penicillium paradoxum]